MDEFVYALKNAYSISIEKLVWVWNRADLQDVNNIITQCFICFIPFKCTHLTDTLSAKCLWYLHNRGYQMFKRKGIYN